MYSRKIINWIYLEGIVSDFSMGCNKCNLLVFDKTFFWDKLDLEKTQYNVEVLIINWIDCDKSVLFFYFKYFMEVESLQEGKRMEILNIWCEKSNKYVMRQW